MSATTEDDLTSYLTETAWKLVVRYDPERSGPGYSFPSWLWDVLSLRTTDFWRKKAEGHGDRRSGSDGRIVLAADPLEDIEGGRR